MSTPSPVYRDDLEGARIRLDELLASWKEGNDERAGVVEAHGARCGRIGAGIAGIAGAAAMSATTLARYLGERSSDAASIPRGLPTWILFWSWGAMAVGYVIGQLVSYAKVGRWFGAPRRTSDPRVDLARLEVVPSVWSAAERADRLERASAALPMIAVGLLAPLSIHGLMYLFADYAHASAAKFDEWIALSLAIVGHAHLVGAFCYYRFAKKARELSIAELDQRRAGFSWKTYGYSVLASAIPGVVFLLLPPILAAVTALVFNPLLYRFMTRRIIAERRAIGVDAPAA